MQNEKRQIFTTEENSKDTWIVSAESIEFNVSISWANLPRSNGTLNFKKGDSIIIENVASVNGSFEIANKYYCVNNLLYFNATIFRNQIKKFIKSGAIDSKK